MRYFALPLIFGLVMLLLSCNEDIADPIAFEEVTYLTSTNQAQQFRYYFDDGEKVADALEEDFVIISTESGAFPTEQLLVLNFRDEIASLPDSIVPYTYLFSTNYQERLNSGALYEINLDYPYTNFAHKSNGEDAFFRKHFARMELLKMTPEENGELYVDPDFIITSVLYEQSESMVSFETDDLGSIYALCWIEKPWIDSISFEIDNGGFSNVVNIVEGGLLGRGQDYDEGATLDNNTLIINYNSASRLETDQTNILGWDIVDLDVQISDPTNSRISMDDVIVDILIQNSSSLATQLVVTESTTIDLQYADEFDERSDLSLNGPMLIIGTQERVDVNLTFNFSRQR